MIHETFENNFQEMLEKTIKEESIECITQIFNNPDHKECIAAIEDHSLRLTRQFKI